MISIIICHINPGYLEAVKENIEQTVGIPFELIAVDNRNSTAGICEVYNKAAGVAKFDVLCFMHEDVKIHSSKWGTDLVTLLRDETIGLVGISGTLYKSDYPSSWSSCQQDLYRVNAIQHFDKKTAPVLHKFNPLGEDYSEVAVIDGVFMACRKSTWQSTTFDSELIRGFHGYDLDFSLSVGESYKIVVTHHILLEHFSAGTIDTDWLKIYVALHKKWKNVLPKNVAKWGEHNRLADYIACSYLLLHLLNVKSSIWQVVKMYFHLLFFFFSMNRFKFTKTLLKYVFLNKQLLLNR